MSDGAHGAEEGDMPSEERQNQQLLDSLNLTEDLRRAIDMLWTTFQGSISEELMGSTLSWYCCWIYVASIDASLPYGVCDPQAQCGSLEQPSITVTDLLKASQVCISEFFDHMRKLKEMFHLSEAVKQHLLAVERQYLISCPLYHKFGKIFADIFLQDEKSLVVNGNADDSGEGDSFLDKKKFCWTLFIYAKGLGSSSPVGLVPSCHLLLNCIHYVLRMTPAFQLKPPFDAARIAGSENESDESMLQELCEHYHASFEEVKTAQLASLDPVIQDLPQLDGSIDVAALIESCRNSFRKRGTINELGFLDKEAYLLPPQVVTEMNNNEETATAENRAPNGQHLYTPVRAALDTVQQLKEMLSTVSDEPSPVLLKYFKNCAVEPTEAVKQGVVQLGDLFIHAMKALHGDQQTQLASHRLTTAVRLYYRVMETLLQQEEERLSQQDFSRLLNNPVFHKCLLACSVELVLTAYASSWKIPSSAGASGPGADQETGFPWILQVFDVRPYDFFRVLESFVKAEQKLTKDLVKHLRGVEEKILDSLAWKSGSPVFEAFQHCETPKPTPPQSTLSEAQETSSGVLYLSPMRMRNPQGSTAHGSPASSPRQRRSQSLSLFINRVCKLAYQRLQVICSLLDISKDLQLKVWMCLEYCITHRPELMKNRHLDQILMCSIYAICKVVDKEIKFKTIVSVYRELPHAFQQNYKQVFISGQEYDSIITFYNRVFMQNLKDYILQFSSNRAPTQSPASHRLQASPVYSLPGRKNFYISPMKPTPFKTPPSPSQMTPRTRQLYNFGEGIGSAEKLKKINDKMRTIQHKTSPPLQSRTSKRLHFDQLDDEASAGEVPDYEEMVPVKRKSLTPKSCKSLTFTEPAKPADSEKKT